MNNQDYMSSIPWFYIWSDQVFDKIMQDTVKGFDLNSIQSEVSSLKERAELIVKCLKETSEPQIVFSVSDLIVKPGFLSEVSKITDDMVFIAAVQNKKETVATDIIYLKNTSDVIDFWSTLASSDTPSLEESLSTFKGKYSKFSDKCVSSNTWDKRTEFNVLQLISSGFGKEFDFAEKVFTMAQHIELQPFMEYVPEDIIPFIYKIQELLFLTHKEMKKTS